MHWSTRMLSSTPVFGAVDAIPKMLHQALRRLCHLRRLERVSSALSGSFSPDLEGLGSALCNLNEEHLTALLALVEKRRKVLSFFSFPHSFRNDYGERHFSTVSKDYPRNRDDPLRSARQRPLRFSAARLFYLKVAESQALPAGCACVVVRTGQPALPAELVAPWRRFPANILPSQSPPSAAATRTGPTLPWPLQSGWTATKGRRC